MITTTTAHIKREPMALTIDGIQLEKFGLLIDKLDKFLYNIFLLRVKETIDLESGTV